MNSSLKGLLVERDLPFLALCLKPVVESLGGVGALSKATGLGRQSLYKTLSGERHPDFHTLLKILDFAGYELSLTKKGSAPAGVPGVREAAKPYGVRNKRVRGSRRSASSPATPKSRNTRVV